MRALVLSGGGARGAWQAGAVRALVERGHQWDVIAGLSVGAINGIFLAMYAPAEQAAGARALERLWFSIGGNASVYRPWLWGRIAALWKGGMYDTAPLERLLREHFDPERLRTSGVRLRIGAVGFGSGRYRCVTEATPDLLSWVMASAAFPVAFPPRWIDGEGWIDGAVRLTTPIRDVLADGPESIDVVLTSPLTGETALVPVARAHNALDVAVRSESLRVDAVFRGDLRGVRIPSGTRVRVYAPRTPLAMDTLDFEPTLLRNAYLRGYEDVRG